MRRTKQEAAKTKELLIEAALRVFHRKGYAASTLVDIAKEANLTRGAVYWHFCSKQEILKIIAETFYSDIDAIIARVMAAQVGPLDRIRLGLTEFFAYVTGDEKQRMLEEILLFKIELSDDLMPLAEDLKNRMNHDKNLAYQIIREGQDCGEIRRDIDPMLAANALSSFVVGAKITWLFDLDDLNKTAHDMIEFAIAGLKT